MTDLVRLERVHAGYLAGAREVHAVHDVTLTVRDDEILGIAGESGGGKSTLIKLIYGQIGHPLHLFRGAATAFVDGEAVPIAELRRYWWDFISYIPQGSMSALNPVLRIEQQMLDAIPPRHRHRGRGELRAALVEMFGQIGLDPGVLRAYPHLLSGGMRQRVLVALAAFLHPRVMLADEPTTALDVVTQKRILILLRGLQRRMRNAVVVVSHDLGVHYQLTHRIAIAYAGEIVEVGPTEAVFAAPLHPYTEALANSIPRLGDDARREGLEGRPPSLQEPPAGCRFHPRCRAAQEICRRVAPALAGRAGDRYVACHLR
jgi:peptide/nickel transport system ATP-binding protein